MKFLNKKAVLTAVVLALSTSAVQAAVDVSTEAAAFQSDFTAGQAVIGAAMLGAGFVAITWKWLKAAIFG